MYYITEMALDLQTQMTADSTSELASQIERMREERSDLMKSAKTNDGLKRVKIKLDETETEMVCLYTCLHGGVMQIIKHCQFTELMSMRFFQLYLPNRLSTRMDISFSLIQAELCRHFVEEAHVMVYFSG